MFAVGASCGQQQGTTPQNDDDDNTETTESDVPHPTASDTADADAVPMPTLPEARQAATPQRTAPTIGNISQAEEALNAGFYEEVEAALPGLGNSAAAKVLKVRWQLATGAYREAAQLAEQAARDQSQRVVATTLRGEALMHVGELDQAERVLRPLESEATAHRARMLLGRLLQRRGRMAEAEPVYMKLIDAFQDLIDQRNAEGLSYVAMAAWGLGSARDANDAYQEANRFDDDRVETQIEWAKLFLAKYDAGHAEENLNVALRVNPNHPEALALMARVKIDQSFNFSEAEELCERALAINPNLVMAHVSLAGMALRDLDIAGADARLNRALQIDPNDLEALSVRAAVRYLADDDAGFERAKREVLRRHRTYSELYNILAEFAEWEHRYPDIVSMAREAVTLNSSDYRAHAALGLNLLRMGDEQQALPALQDAWRRDRFNVRVYNTLNFYDDVIPAQYEEFTNGPFVFRMHQEERPILERYIPRTLRRAYQSMVRRYGFTPDGPVRIELFANPGHFSVRTTGLPNLGVQGVCFGKVVTAISPRGGPFNWGQITWHELAHVFHIQLSRNRVPRWFTEGLAEYETLIARSEWKREMDHHLWQALDNDRLPPLRLMNRAFTRARSAMDMMVAYYASTRIVKYIADEHGFDKVVRMLREWAAGRPTADVVQRSLGIDVDTLDRNFRAHARQRLRARANDFQVDFGQYTELEPIQQAAQAAPQDAAKQAALAAAQLVGGDAEAAQATAARAIQLETNQPVARFVLARLALMQRDGETADGHLRAIIAGGKDGYEVRLLLARSALGREQQDVARRELEAATRIDAERPEAWQGLVEVAGDDNDLKIRALTALASIDEHDRETNATLLEMLVNARRWDDALSIGEMGTFVDPANGQVHRLLAQVYLEKNRNDDALYELDSALVVGHPQPGTVHILRAHALHRLGRRNDAREAARAAVAADESLSDQAQRYLGGNP